MSAATEPQYKTSHEQCLKTISGVCEGCGGELEPLETFDNSGAPTWWVGCTHCGAFRGGVDRRYWEIARQLVERNGMIPYTHMSRKDYEDTPEKLSYWLDSQCAGLSREIKRIHILLEDKFKVVKP